MMTALQQSLWFSEWHEQSVLRDFGSSKAISTVSIIDQSMLATTESPHGLDVGPNHKVWYGLFAAGGRCLKELPFKVGDPVRPGP